MGVSRLIIAINKLDAMDYKQEVFDAISADIQRAVERLDVQDIHIIPMSALAGDYVVFPSEKMHWY
jgi:bifunctional enzyme CysN/CysC